MDRAEAVAKMSDEERNTSLTDLLLSVGLRHSRKDGFSREVARISTGEVLGLFSYDEALVLFVETRDAL